jgi:hypothetical protein
MYLPGWMQGGNIMRYASVAQLLFLTLLCNVPAARASDADIVRQFGILGRLALNCSAPYSNENPYLIYSVSAQGKVTRALQKTPNLDGKFAMRNIRMAGPDLMQYDETGRTSDMTISVAKIGGKFRSWRSVRSSGPDKGTVLIADGKFAKGGNPTPAFELCKN